MSVLAGVDALALDPRGGGVGLVVERLGPRFRGLGFLRRRFRLLGEALRLGLFGGGVLPLGGLLGVEAVRFRRVGLGLVAMGLGPGGQSFLLDPLLLTAAARGEHAEHQDRDDHEDDDHYQHGRHLSLLSRRRERRTRRRRV
jgi:hypothetical protein